MLRRSIKPAILSVFAKEEHAMIKTLVPSKREKEVWRFWEQQAQWQRQATDRFAAYLG